MENKSKREAQRAVLLKLREAVNTQEELDLIEAELAELTAILDRQAPSAENASAENTTSDENSMIPGRPVKLSKIREVWECWDGRHWFVTDYDEGDFFFLLAEGWEIEWEFSDLKELRELAKKSWVWKVPQEKWPFLPCVEDDRDSFPRKVKR